MHPPSVIEIPEAEISKSTIELTQEIKEKKNDYEQLETQRKKIKSTHKNEIKEYHSLSKSILQLEDTIDSFEKTISNIKTKQQLILSNITDEYPYYLKAMSQRVLPGIMQSLILFTGFKIEQETIFLNLIKSGMNLKQLLENADSIQHQSNKINRLASCSSSSLFQNIQNKINDVMMDYKKDLVYPFDIIYDYIILVYESIDKENQRDKCKEEIEDLINNKNSLFIKLKQSENDIIKNESNLDSLDKYITQLNECIYKSRISKCDYSKCDFMKLSNSIESIKKKEVMLSTIPKTTCDSTKPVLSFSTNNLAKSHNNILPKEKQNIPIAANYCLSKITKNIKDVKRNSINIVNSNNTNQKKNNQRSIHSFQITQIRQQLFNSSDQKLTQAREKEKEKGKIHMTNIVKNKVLQSNNRYGKNIHNNNNGNDKYTHTQTQKSSNLYEEDTTISTNNIQTKDITIDNSTKRKSNQRHCNKQEFSSLLSNQTQSGLFNSLSNDIYINNNDSVCDELVGSQKEFIKRQTSKLLTSSPIRTQNTRNIRNRNDLVNFCVEKSINQGGCCVSCT